MTDSQNQPLDAKTDSMQPAGPRATADEASPDASPERRQDEDYRAARAAAAAAAVQALTAAARLRHPRFGRLDFADLLADVLAAVAANLGSVHALLAGRPGSWEADLVAQLVHGTVGWDEQYLVEHRTEPVVIHLNVHRLLYTSTTGDTPYEADLASVDTSLDAALATAHTEQNEEAAWARHAADTAAVEASWAARYAAYAQSFAAAVVAEATHIDGLPVPLVVHANTDPDGGADDTPNTDETDDYQYYDDPVLVQLWDAARAAVRLPGAENEPS